MKLLVITLACAAIFALPVRAATAQHQRVVILTKHPANHLTVARITGMFLLEDRPAAVLPRAENLLPYPTMEY